MVLWKCCVEYTIFYPSQENAPTYSFNSNWTQSAKYIVEIFRFLSFILYFALIPSRSHLFHILPVSLSLIAALYVSLLSSCIYFCSIQIFLFYLILTFNVRTRIIYTNQAIYQTRFVKRIRPKNQNTSLEM